MHDYQGWASGSMKPATWDTLIAGTNGYLLAMEDILRDMEQLNEFNSLKEKVLASIEEARTTRDKLLVLKEERER